MFKGLAVGSGRGNYELHRRRPQVPHLSEGTFGVTRRASSMEAEINVGGFIEEVPLLGEI